MSDWDDLHDVTLPRISNENAERLLSDTSGIDETNGLADLSTVFSALRGPAEPAELAGLHSVLDAFGAAVVTSQSDPSNARTRPMIKKLLTGKAIAAIGVITLASAGAAAASGVVPTPFSSSKPSASTSPEVVADDPTEEIVGTDILVDTNPSTDNVIQPAQLPGTDAATVADVAASTDGQGPDVNGPAKFGLCTAYEARTKHDATTTATEAAATVVAQPVSEDGDSALPVPFQALSDAADAAGLTVAEFCADAVPGGSADAPGQSGDNPSATAPGKSDDNPSATAPGKLEDNPPATAPGKSEDNPSATAPGKSGGPPDNPGGDHGKKPQP